MNEIEKENIELKKELQDLRHEFIAWKRLHLPEIFDDNYETLCFEQLEFITKLRRQLKERDKQCVELYKKLKNFELNEENK